MNTYHMLIVDDEYEILESLYETITRANFDSLDVTRTSSAREALSILNSTHIDILMTDIHMPLIKGFELAQIAHSNWPKCRVIFLTGFSEFEYAHKAIKCDCDDYLLKMESDNKILESVQNSLAKLEKSLNDDKILEKAKKQIKLATTLLQRDFIKDLLNGIVKPSDLCQKTFDEHEIPLNITLGSYIIVARIDEVCADNKTASTKPEVSLSVRDVISDSFSHKLKILYNYDSSTFLCIIQEICMAEQASVESECQANDAATIKGTIKTIQDVCSRTMNISISFAVCIEPVYVDQFTEKFAHLKGVLDINMSIKGGTFYTDKSFTSTIADNSAPGDVVYNSNDASKFNISDFSHYLEQGLQKEYFKLLSEATDSIRKIKTINNSYAQQLYYTISNCLLSYIIKCNIYGEIGLNIDLNKITNPQFHETWSDASDYLCKLSQAIFTIQNNHLKLMSASSISLLQDYISKNLNEDLSLYRLASIVHLNPSYLSRLFKQNTGMNISDYILNERISKAKYLLTQTDDKVYEIVAKVGLESPIYFSRVFKKVMNITPIEYRELYIKKLNKMV